MSVCLTLSALWSRDRDCEVPGVGELHGGNVNLSVTMACGGYEGERERGKGEEKGKGNEVTEVKVC